ncbi:hypothetical protein IHE48_17900 [Frankia sp. CH37]|nr:hypothetical protein [Parafrankia sp. CH37]
MTATAAGPASAAGPGGGGPGGGGGRTSAPTVDGVKVGWLPRGVSLVDVQPTTRIGRNVIVARFEGADTRVSLTIQRETPDATLDEVASAYAQYYPAQYLGRIALRGTEAVTLRASSGGINELTWVEGDPSVVLTVGGSVGGIKTPTVGPLPEADLLRIAGSLTVGPAPAQTAWQKASEPRIRAAFPAALNSSEAPPRVPLAAVENGQRLVSLLEQFRATYPGLTAQITVNQVYVWAHDRASVTFTIAYSYGGFSGSIGSSGQAVFDHGSWKVSEQTYRNVLGLASGLGGAVA